MAEPSKGTVVVALGANVVVALGKLVGGALTGSAAMLSEGAHSVADTLNETFLLTALRRSGRPADARHPFGYGMERFFWSFLAAVGIFVLGAGFSVVQAYRSLTGSETVGAHYYLVSYLVLGVAFVAEGISWLRAIRQVRTEAAAAGRGLPEHLRRSGDPSVKTVAGEDTAAIVGLLFASAGIGLHQLTGNPAWEGVASLLIAGLLVVVAIALGRDVKGLLIGEAADPRLRRDVAEFLDEHPGVDEVVDLLTMQLGVDRVLLAARLDLADDLTSADVEALSAELDEAITQRWPEVGEVFIDATRTTERIDRVGLTDLGEIRRA